MPVLQMQRVDLKQELVAYQESFNLQQVVITATSIRKLQDKKERLQELAGHGGAQLQHESWYYKTTCLEPGTDYVM